MKKSPRMPLAKTAVTIALGLTMLAATVGLTGCTDKHITEVKALPFSYPDENVQDPNLMVDQALDYRKVCDSVKWKVDKTEQHQMFVEYQCDYKNVEHSAFVANDVLKAKVERGDKADGKDITHLVHAGDVYQWTYGPNGSPALSYVSLRLQYSNGASKDIPTYGPSDVTRLMRAAAENNADDFDHIYAAATYTQIPPMPTADTEASLREEYKKLHPRILSATDLAQLFSPKVIGLPVSQYESLVRKFAGESVKSYPLDDGTIEQIYEFTSCVIKANTGQGKVLGVRVPLDGRCPVTDADMPSYLQGKQWDWSRLLAKNVTDLADQTTSHQSVSCVAAIDISQQPRTCLNHSAMWTTTIGGSKADGFVSAAFSVEVADMYQQLWSQRRNFDQRTSLKPEEVNSAAYSKDPIFMKEAMEMFYGNLITSITLQQGSLGGRIPHVHPSQSMASTAMTQPNPVSATAPATSAPTAVATDASKTGDVSSDGWPKMTPCIKTLQDKFMTDQEKQNADTSTSMEQMQEWADVCKSLGK